MVFFKKGEVNEPITNNNNIQPEVTQTAIKVSQVVKTRNKNLSLFDIDTMKYVIEHFPSTSDEIEEALLNLSDVLENAINFIEDKSSDVIKQDRNFELSQSYRDTSISLYKVAQKIQDYVDWMKDENEKYLKEDDKELGMMNKTLTESVQVKEEVQEVKEEDDDSVKLPLYKDFTGKNPKEFILYDNRIEVENWDDLIVKLAEVLNKKYRQNKYINKTVHSVAVQGKASEENDFRDTIIEMINEYNISNTELKIVI